MLKIRLQRIGRRHDPQFRVVLTDSRRGPKSGGFKEILGSYNAKKGDIVLDGDRIKHWIGFGAQTSGTVHNFLISQGIIEGKKINVLPKKTPIVDHEAIAKAKEEAEAAEAKVAEEKAAAEEAAKAPEEVVEETPTEEPATEEEDSSESEEVVATEAKEEETPAEEEKTEEAEA